MTSAKRRPFIRGMRGYASIVASVWRRPATAQELFGRFKITQRQLLLVLRQLRTLRLVYVKAWRPSRSHDRNFSRVWAFNVDGLQEDAPVPVGVSGRAQATAQTLASRPGIEGIAFHRLVEAMKDPHTIGELVEEAGVRRSVLYKFLAHAREAGLVRVADWAPNATNHLFPMFAIGRSPDAPKPGPTPNVERCRQYVKRRAQRQQSMLLTLAIAGRAE